jgi:hypothetical protein
MSSPMTSTALRFDHHFTMRSEDQVICTLLLHGLVPHATEGS